MKTKKEPNQKKFSDGLDPLDNSPLVDPVALQIKHKKFGSVTLMVNRRNKKIYLKKGPKAFPRKKATPSAILAAANNNRYYIKKAGVSEKENESSDFGLVDYLVLRGLFTSDQHDDSVYISDEKFARSGGKSGGGGASESFSVDKDDSKSGGAEQQPPAEKEDVTESNAEKIDDVVETNSPSDDDGSCAGD